MCSDIMDRSACNSFWNSCGLYTIATTTSLITAVHNSDDVVKQKQTKEAFYDDKKEL
jgi:hypothetical protein